MQWQCIITSYPQSGPNVQFLVYSHACLGRGQSLDYSSRMSVQVSALHRASLHSGRRSRYCQHSERHCMRAQVPNPEDACANLSVPVLDSKPWIALIKRSERARTDCSFDIKVHSTHFAGSGSRSSCTSQHQHRKMQTVNTTMCCVRPPTDGSPEKAGVILVLRAGQFLPAISCSSAQKLAPGCMPRCKHAPDA